MAVRSDTRVPFEEYILPEMLRDGVMNGKYLIGRHHIPQKWTHDRSYVRNHSYFPNEVDICIPTRKDRNRAFDGDTVAVEVIGWDEKSQSTVPESTDFFARPSEPCFADDDNVNAVKRKPQDEALQQTCIDYGMDSNLRWEANQQPLGKIVFVIRANEIYTIGRVHLPQANPSSLNVRISPYNPKLPHCMVSRREFPEKIREDLDNHLLLVKVIPGDWKVKNLIPPAHFVKSVGFTGTVDGETSAILTMHDIDDSPFSSAVLESIPKDIEVPPPGVNSTDRLDLRESEFVCSIDPSTARDLDDALSIRKLKNGNFRVGVHIADVSTYVPELSDVDLEAQKRATSVYLCQKVIPMLPPSLSEQQCSLNTNSDKFAFSVMWDLDRHGNIVPQTQWIGKTIIRNRCQLAYEDAQSIILEEPVSDRCSHLDEATLSKVNCSVKNLWKLAKQIRSRRFDSGSINLEQQELSFVTSDNDISLAPIDFYVKKQLEANNLVEEFMLLANKSIAEKLHELVPATALVRRHEKPDADLLRFYKEFLKEHQIEIAISTGAEFARSVRQISSDDALSSYISALLIRSFSRAQYVAAKNHETPLLHHYALNMGLYTHFTSPIRRYADLYVHRLLSKLLDRGELNESTPLDQDSDHLKSLGSTPTELCEHLNERADKARAASDGSQDLFLCLYLDNVRKVALEKGDVHGAYRLMPARLIKVKKSAIMIYVRDIASYFEISFKSNRQLWSRMEVKDQTSVEVVWKDVSALKKGDSLSELADAFKSMHMSDETVVDAHCLPSIAILDKLTVSLVVGHRSPLKIDAIIHPPEYYAKALPAPLLDYLRSK